MGRSNLLVFDSIGASQVTVEQRKNYNIDDLQSIMEKLLSDEGCPWDREQTLTTLIPYLIEETYEVVDALENKDSVEHCDELGDLLFQIIFQSALQSREDRFNFSHVVGAICDKLIRRHPHVFDKTANLSAQEVEAQWEEIKKGERKSHGAPHLLDKVAANGPSLVTAYKYSKKAAKVGFDWKNTDDCMAKIEEEIAEIKEAGEDKDKVEEEIGDLLFAVVSFARKHGVDPSKSLRRANNKFRTRFNYIEDNIKAQNQDWKDVTLEDLDRYWDEHKKFHE